MGTTLYHAIGHDTGGDTVSQDCHFLTTDDAANRTRTQRAWSHHGITLDTFTRI